MSNIANIANEKPGKYWSYCIRNQAITNAYIKCDLLFHILYTRENFLKAIKTAKNKNIMAAIKGTLM